jgi:fimbrial isopeptide formation D2 family protein
MVSGQFANDGTYAIVVRATSVAGTSQKTVNIKVQPYDQHAVIWSPTTATGTVGQRFDYTIEATNHLAIYDSYPEDAVVYYGADNLPPGLMIDTSAVSANAIVGVPTQAGTYVVSLFVTDAFRTSNATLQITILDDPAFPRITSPSVVAVHSGQAFTYQIEATGDTDSSDPLTYTYTGTLPAGLSFDSTSGTISGVLGDDADTTTPRNVPLVVNATNQHGTASKQLTLSVNPLGAENISTRIRVEAGEGALIGGFIITGAEGMTKRVVIRAIGPSLTEHGVSDALTDPKLTLFNGNGQQIASNDNWRDSSSAGEIDSNGLAPTRDEESALLVSLTPGNYTAQVTSANGSTGIGLVEAYDLDAGKTQLANISTRAQVQTDENVLIGGFILGTTAPSRIVLRAIGPALEFEGVAGALQDPLLELHNANGDLMTTNDDWRDTQESELLAVNLNPKFDRESAIIVTLLPGRYTAIMRGKNGTTGIGLVEVYNLGPAE